MSTTGRRFFPRMPMPCNHYGYARVLGRRYSTADILDISGNGVRLEMFGRYEVGQSVWLHLRPCNADKTIMAEGIIRHVTEANARNGQYHHGIEFAFMNDKARAMLKKYLKKLGGSS